MFEVRQAPETDRSGSFYTQNHIFYGGNDDE
nr:MAG TPA: hypothetical protein [Caudoviricetes sp.]DAZ29309.1 MAG TPA: hypothetical protein [Caudoviricetes sp.]